MLLKFVKMDIRIDAKITIDNLKLANLMQTYENFLLQNYLTECFDIANK